VAIEDASRLVGSRIILQPVSHINTNAARAEPLCGEAAQHPRLAEVLLFGDSLQEIPGVFAEVQ